MEPRGSSKLNGGSSKLNGSSFWKSLQRNVKKHMGCFSVVAGRPKDARRALSIKPAGNAKHMGGGGGVSVWLQEGQRTPEGPCR